MTDRRQRAGAALTNRLLEVIMPIVDGEDTELVIEAMAAAFIVVLQVAGTDEVGRAVVVHRYKAAIDHYLTSENE